MTTVRIKRRAASAADATPPLPADLANAELAFNEFDNILYYGSGGTAAASATVIPIAGGGAGGEKTVLPLANDATALCGGAITFSLSDHVHPTDPAIALGDAAVTTAFQAADAGKVSIAGDTMTGALVLPVADPTLATHAAHKGYVDAQVSTAGAVPSDNDPLENAAVADPGLSALYSREDHVHPSDPAIADIATQLADYLPLAGGTLTGSVDFTGLTTTLTLALDPALAMEAATKQYVDTVSGDVAADLADYLPLAGGALSGALTTSSTVTLAANPVANLEAATKQYVDASVTASAYTFDVGLVEAAGNVDVIQATPTALGGAMIATAALITAGADDATIVSPLGLRGQLGADAATLVTTVKTIVPAINEMYTTIEQLVGVIIFAGNYDATLGEATFNGQGGIAAGTGPLPSAAVDNHGAYLIVTVGGPGSGVNEPTNSIGVGDWLYSDGSQWLSLPFSQAPMTAANIGVVPAVAGGDTVQDALEGLELVVNSALQDVFFDAATFGGDALTALTKLTLDMVDGGVF